jgi:pilus assembly protein Flp/PilA
MGFLRNVARTGEVRRTGDQRPASGQGLAEYALILALIAIVAIVALIFLGDQISRILNDVAGSI